MNLRRSVVVLLRALSLIFFSLLLYKIDFFGFGALFFERNPTVWLVVPAWFVFTMIRAFVGALTASLILSITRGVTLTKRNLAICYFIVGPPLYTTNMTILTIMNLSIFPEQVRYLLPTYFLGLFREPIESWFTAQGFSYEAYLRVYFSSVEPFIAELPRLILLILVIMALQLTHITTIASGPSPSHYTPQNRLSRRPRSQSQGQ